MDIGMSERVLIAREGYYLTNGEFYSKMVYLGIRDVPENWHEIPESEVDENPTAEEILDILTGEAE